MLPQINQKADEIIIDGIKYSAKEMVELIATTTSLSAAAKKSGIKLKDLREINAYLKNRKADVQEDVAETSNTPAKSRPKRDTSLRNPNGQFISRHQKMLLQLIDIMQKNLKVEQDKIRTSSLLEGMGSRIRATGLDFKLGGFQAMYEESKGSPNLLANLIDVVEKQLEIQKKTFELEKNRDRLNEENRLENIRKYGNEKGFMDWMVNGQTDRKKGQGNNLVDSLGEIMGGLVGFLIDPKTFGAILGFSAIKTALPRMLRSKVTGLAFAIFNGVMNGIDAAGKASEWGVPEATAVTAGFLAGSEDGGMMNALTNGAGWAFTGASIGGAVGGIPGALAGSLVGGVLGAIVGYFGSERLAKLIDEGFKSVSEWSDQNLGSVFNKSAEEIIAELNEAKANIEKVTNRINESTVSLTAIQEQINAAMESGDQALIDDLNARKREMEDSLANQKIQLAISKKEAADAMREYEEKSMEWWDPKRLYIGPLQIFESTAQWFDVKKAENEKAMLEHDREAEEKRKALWTAVSGFSDWAWNGVANAFSTGIGNIDKSIADLTANMNLDWIETGFNNIVGSIQNWWDSIVGSFQNFFSDPVGAIRKMMSGETTPTVAPTNQSYDIIDGLMVPNGKTIFGTSIGPSLETLQADVQRTETSLPGSFIANKALRDASMRMTIAQRDSAYSAFVRGTAPISQANPSVFNTATTNNQSINNINSTQISQPINPLAQTLIGNW